MADEKKPEDHGFDRRQSDANARALRQQLQCLEDTVHQLMMPNLTENTRICKENTRICKDLHCAFFGESEEKPGVSRKVDEMYDSFALMKNGMRVLGALGNAVIWCLEKGRIFWLALLISSLWGWHKTGHFNWEIFK